MYGKWIDGCVLVSTNQFPELAAIIEMITYYRECIYIYIYIPAICLQSELLYRKFIHTSILTNQNREFRNATMECFKYIKATIMLKSNANEHDLTLPKASLLILHWIMLDNVEILYVEPLYIISMDLCCLFYDAHNRCCSYKKWHSGCSKSLGTWRTNVEKRNLTITDTSCSQ